MLHPGIDTIPIPTDPFAPHTSSVNSKSDQSRLLRQCVSSYAFASLIACRWFHGNHLHLVNEARLCQVGSHALTIEHERALICTLCLQLNMTSSREE